MTPSPVDLPLTAAGVRWEAAPGLIERLAVGRYDVLKDAPHCAVYRVSAPGLDVHVKHYRPAGARSRARALVRGDKGRAEAERTREVAARGVPTLEPLAVGEGQVGSFFVTRTLDGGRNLIAFLEEELPAFPAHRRARVRQALAAALGRFLVRMHAAGVVHADLHPGNLLLRLGPDDAPELFLIDLFAVRLGPSLDWPRSRDNLVVLNRWFALRSSRADRRRFWRAYWAARALPLTRHPSPPWRGRGVAGEGSPLNERDAARDVERRTLISNLRFWRGRDRRCLGGNRWFRRVRSGASVGHAVADVDPAVLAPLLADPDGPFRRPGAAVLKDSPSSTVIEFDLPIGGAPRRVVYKRFAVTRWTDPWAALFRPPPALRSYVMGHGLRLRGLPTPRPLAVWHRTHFGLLWEGYLLTEKAAGAVELPAHVAGLARLPAAERRAALDRLIDQAARLIAALHERRLSHRDLKGANLLVNAVPWSIAARGVVEGGPPAGPQLWFIDLVGVRRHARLSPARRARDLARLYASFHGRGLLTRTDLLRFLRAYLGWGQQGGADWQAWHRTVRRAFGAKLRRNRRNGRPLG
jgi:tRNA A-37 threonylcarbamoyl transferase component Bud32